MKYLLFLKDFVLIFILVDLLFYFINKSRKKKNKYKEVDAFIKRYEIDTKKLDYSKIVRISGIINTFIISFVSTLFVYINNFYIALIVCFVITISLYYSLYEITFKYIKKKEENKNV